MTIITDSSPSVKEKTPFLDTHDTLKAALDYASHGLPVFPCCWPDANGNCGCGRDHQGRDIGKAPLTTHGFKDATLEKQLILNYFKQYPLANLGIAIPLHYSVLDIDILHGGFESFAKLQATIGVLPDTFLITTGTGGAHHWHYSQTPITHGNRSLSKQGYPGIDIKSPGGYVVAPPSKHRCGGYYEIAENRLVAEAPMALIQLINTASPKAEVSTTTEGELIPPGEHDRWLHKRASTYRGQGDTEEVIIAKLRLDLPRLKDSDPTDPYTDKDLLRLARSVRKYPPGHAYDPLKTSGRI